LHNTPKQPYTGPLNLGGCEFGMQFNVAQLQKESIGSLRSFTIDESYDTDQEAEETIAGSVQLMRTDQGIWVSASLTIRLRTTCSRCLQPTYCQLPITIEEEYFPSLNISTGASLQPRESDAGGALIDNHHILDLYEALRQYHIVNMPMKPLCRSACRGLCPNCGTDRNLINCSCSMSSVDNHMNLNAQFSNA